MNDNIILYILVWILYIIVIATSFSFVEEKSVWERFTKQDGVELYEYCNLNGSIPDFITR